MIPRPVPLLPPPRRAADTAYEPKTPVPEWLPAVGLLTRGSRKIDMVPKEAERRQPMINTVSATSR